MTTIDERVASRKAELDVVRPLPGSGLAALSSWYDVELTYTSNAIKGNTLTRGETALVIEKGITIGGKPLRDHLEAVGNKDALDYIRSLARQDQPVREADTRQVHALLIGRIDTRPRPDATRRISGSSRALACCRRRRRRWCR